jgi:hypothetical protein
VKAAAVTRAVLGSQDKQNTSKNSLLGTKSLSKLFHEWSVVHQQGADIASASAPKDV